MFFFPRLVLPASAAVCIPSNSGLWAINFCYLILSACLGADAGWDQQSAGPGSSSRLGGHGSVPGRGRHVRGWSLSSCAKTQDPRRGFVSPRTTTILGGPIPSRRPRPARTWSFQAQHQHNRYSELPPNMWILPLVGYLGSIVGFCFMTLAIGMSWMPHTQLPPACPCPFLLTDGCLHPDSLWPLLPLRARRGAHRHREALPQQADLLHHGPAAVTLHRRPLPLPPDRPGHLLAFCLPGQYAPLPLCQADRSSVPGFVRYVP